MLRYVKLPPDIPEAVFFYAPAKLDNPCFPDEISVIFRVILYFTISTCIYLIIIILYLFLRGDGNIGDEVR